MPIFKFSGGSEEIRMMQKHFQWWNIVSISTRDQKIKEINLVYIELYDISIG